MAGGVFLRKFSLMIMTVFVALFVSMSFYNDSETVYGENSKVAVGKVTASALNVRSEPKQNSRRIGILSEGATVQIAEVDVNKNWYKIRFNNQWGFVHKNYVMITENHRNKPSNSVVGKGEVTASTLNVRAEPNQNSRRVSVLHRGTMIDIYEVGINRNWLKIKVNNEWAYVHGDFVTVTAQTPPPAPRPTNQVVGQGTVAVNALNVRAEANQSSRRLSVLSQGTKIDIYEKGVNKDWLKIKVNNEWAYVHGDFVTVTAKTNSATPTPTNQVVGQGTVAVNALNVRAEANQSSRRLSVLSQGTKIDIYEVGVNKDWLKIKVNNDWAYVHGDFVNISGSLTNVDTKKLANKVIVVDPGHGGRDPGAVAFGLKEKDIVLDVSLILQKKLEQAGAKVHMTRTKDVYVSLGNRVQTVKKENADIFLSLHVNSAAIASAHGTETFWNRNFQRFNSHLLANSVQDKLVDTLGTRDRGVKEAGFEIIKYTQVPSVLIELGFLTNRAEAEKLANRIYQEQAAEAIVAGLVDYYNKNQ